MIYSTIWNNDPQLPVQCEAMILSAMLSNDTQYSVKQWSTVQCEAMILSAILSNDPLYSLKQWSSAQC